MLQVLPSRATPAAPINRDLWPQQSEKCVIIIQYTAPAHEAPPIAEDGRYKAQKLCTVYLPGRESPKLTRRTFLMFL